jgi:hypothetical protein
MFLKQLYHFNRWLFLCFAIFLLAMAFINYKWGMVATPIQQYGMYSAKVYTSDTQKVFQLNVNGKPIDFSKYSLTDRDMMQIPINDFERQAAVNNQAYTTMKSLFNKIGLGRLMPEQKFTNSTTNQQFTVWYKKQLEKRLGYAVDSLSVFDEHYVWQKDQLTRIGQPEKSPVIVTE